MLLMLLHGKKKLNEVEKQIKSGNYIKPDEQRLLYQELDVSFKEFIAGITEIYPKMSRGMFIIVFCPARIISPGTSLCIA